MDERQTGIGGSDIGGVCGTTPLEPYHKTAYEIYEEKVNGIFKNIANTDAVLWGTLLEEPIAQFYEVETGKKLCCTSTIRHKDYPFLMANPDRLIIGEARGLEIKTAGYHMRDWFGESGSQQVPERYYLQVAHYMCVLNYPIWDLIVLIGGQEFRKYTFERDKEIEEMIIDKANNFWKNCVEKKIPPPIDYANPEVQKLIKKKYNLVSDECVELGDPFKEDVKIIQECRDFISHYSNIKNKTEAKILEAMGNAGRAIIPNGFEFIRKKIERKGYTVAPTTYIKLQLKGE